MSLLFVAGEINWNLISGWFEESSPFIPSQSFLFWWNKRMQISYDFISGSVYMTFCHPKWNFISVKMTAIKWHPQWVSFRFVSCEQLYEIDQWPKWKYFISFEIKSHANTVLELLVICPLIFLFRFVIIAFPCLYVSEMVFINLCVVYV